MLSKTKNSKTKKIFVTAILGILASSANAVLMSADFLSTGDGLLTVDSGTGLEWLDMTQTLNQSYNTLIAGYNGYTTTYGFRYATAAEVTTFFTNAGIPVIDQFVFDNYQAANVDPANALIALIGTGSPSFMDAIIADPADASSHRAAVIQGTPNLASATATFVCAQCGIWNDSATEPRIGSFLVRAGSSQVPVPATLALLALGVAGVGYRQRKWVEAA